jgi:hypothetical protein
MRSILFTALLLVASAGCNSEDTPLSSTRPDSSTTQLANEDSGEERQSAQAQTSEIAESEVEPLLEDSTVADAVSSTKVSELEGPAEPFRIELSDVTLGSGLDFEHFAGRTGKHYIMETISCGLASFDYDGDGLIDLYLPNGAALQGSEIEPAPTNRLFRNLGDFRFEDVTEYSNAGDIGFALGVCVCDYDNDGDPDLVVTNFGPSIILDNQGDGTFVRREIYPLTDYDQIGAGVAVLDFDRDGLSDIYIANYIKFSYDKDVSRMIFGVPSAPGPKDYEPDSDILLKNLGDGRFHDVSNETGIAKHAGPGMGVIACDLDQDSDTDLFVCNDSEANFLFLNQGDGTFVEDALLASVAYGNQGDRQASMGVDVGDINHDQLPDLVSTNFAEEVPNYYQNAGGGLFDDIGANSGLGEANQSVSWGVGIADLDNDTWEDCFIVAGHLIDSFTEAGEPNRFRAPHHVYRNVSGKFSSHDVGGTAFTSVRVSRGSALDDFNNDGLIDAVVLNLNESPQLVRNETRNSNRFLHVTLIGTESNRDAVGSTVRLELDSTTLTREVIRGRGYQSHYGSRLHFGLGTDTGLLSLTVRWASGREQTFTKIPPDSSMQIVEGENRFRSMEQSD